MDNSKIARRFNRLVKRYAGGFDRSGERIKRDGLTLTFDHKNRLICPRFFFTTDPKGHSSHDEHTSNKVVKSGA